MPVISIDPAQARRNRLPFKPPSRQSTGSSSAAANKTAAAASKSTSRKRASSPTASSSKPKKSRKSSSSKTAATSAATNFRKRKVPSLSSDAESASEDNSENESNNNDDDNDNTPDSSRSGSPSFKEPEYILAEIVTNDRPRDIESGEPGIPPKLLTRLLHHHFQNPKTKITKDANEVVAKYMDIFVRETLARAAYERAEGNAANGDGRRSMVDGFLEVEDLEKLAPQMLLDF